MAHRGKNYRLAFRRDLSEFNVYNDQGWKANYWLFTQTPLDGLYSGSPFGGIPVHPTIYEPSPFRYLYGSPNLVYLGQNIEVQFGTLRLGALNASYLTLQMFSLDGHWAARYDMPPQHLPPYEAIVTFSAPLQPQGLVPAWVPLQTNLEAYGVIYGDEPALPWPPDVPGGP